MTHGVEGEIGASGRWRRDDRVAWRDIAGEALLIHPARSLMYPLDEVGSAIWGLLDGTRDAGAVAAEIHGRFDVEEAEAARDVARFLDELAEAGLIVRT
jgi:hypothetical protein